MGIDSLKIIGKYTIWECVDDKIISKTTHKNIVTKNMHKVLLEALSGEFINEDYKIEYLAVGSGNESPTENDTEMDNQIGEFKKILPDGYYKMQEESILQTMFYFDKNEAEFYGTWKEMGVYSGNQEYLYSRILIDPNKIFDISKNMFVNYELLFESEAIE